MKPMLDRMVAMVVANLSGKARAFYDREFDFFKEVTDISGKLKPFIKKTKPEKKARTPIRSFCSLEFLTSSCRPRSTKKWKRLLWIRKSEFTCRATRTESS